jgi:hypothetical protein
MDRASVDRAISLGSMSKTYGLPGLRLGWLASRDRAALAKIARSASFGSRGSRTRHLSVSGSLRMPASSCFPAPSMTSRHMCDSDSVARPCATPWDCSRPGSKHVLNAARPGSANDAQGFRTTCRYTLSITFTPPSREATDMGDATRLTTWIDWYRFARRALELGHAEASSYATARYVEEQNRTVASEWRAA